MEVKAQLNNLRIAPRKVRLLADLIRGKDISEAKTILNFNLKRGALPLLKLLNSAIASAKNNLLAKEEDLIINEIKVNGGPKMKRWRARARGRANRIEKKTSHVSLVLGVISGERLLGKELVKKADRRQALEYDIQKEIEPDLELSKPRGDKKPEEKPKKVERSVKKIAQRFDFKTKGKSFVGKIFRRKAI